MSISFVGTTGAAGEFLGSDHHGFAILAHH